MLTGDIVIDAKTLIAVTVHDIFCRSPSNGIGIPCSRGHVGERAAACYSRLTFLVVENLGKLGAREGIIGPKQTSAISNHQLVSQDVVYGLVIPYSHIPQVNKIAGRTCFAPITGLLRIIWQRRKDSRYTYRAIGHYKGIRIAVFFRNCQRPAILRGNGNRVSLITLIRFCSNCHNTAIACASGVHCDLAML